MKKLNLLITLSLIMMINNISLAQGNSHNAKIIGIISIGGNDVASINDTETGILYKTALYPSGKLSSNQDVQLVFLNNQDNQQADVVHSSSEIITAFKKIDNGENIFFEDVIFSEYWIIETSKTEFLNSITNNIFGEEELEKFAASLPDQVKQIIVFNNGMYEEYLNIHNNGDAYYKYMSAPITSTSISGNNKFHSISISGNAGVIEVKEHVNNGNNKSTLTYTLKSMNNGNATVLEKNTLTMQNVSGSNNRFVVSNNPPSSLGRFCCAACYYVHDKLDIHILDCLCCLASCGFSCGEILLLTE